MYNISLEDFNTKTVENNLNNYIHFILECYFYGWKVSNQLPLLTMFFFDLTICSKTFCFAPYLILNNLDLSVFW